MKQALKQAVLNRFGESFYQKMRLFFKKKTPNLIDLKIGNITIKCPDDHPLIKWKSSQPYRDLAIGIIAEFVGQKYPKQKVIDIGANIGDTAAMISSYTNNPLVLVEPSDYFYKILIQNLKVIPNVERVEKVIVSDGNSKVGFLREWEASAYFEHLDENGYEFPSKKLEEIAESNTKLVKIDTDGFDFSIIQTSLEWLSKLQPLLFYENQIRDAKSFNDSNQTLENLVSIGYKYFIVWDDPGFHLISTSNINHLLDVNRYLFKVWSSNAPHKSIHNYDFLCLPPCDQDIFEFITNYYRSY